MLIVHMSSIDDAVAGVEWVVVLCKNDSNNRHRNWMVMQVAVTLISVCSYLCWCHYHSDNNHCAMADDCSTHRNNCHLAYDSLHNAHLDPSLGNMDAPKRLAVAFLGDVHYNEPHVDDVCCDVLE